MVDVLKRHNATISGAGEQTLLFAHGYGCDQSMWRLVAPRLEPGHRLVAFDYIGMGGTDTATYEPERYATLSGYAADVVDICDALGGRKVVFVGHSVSAMVGVLAANLRPDLFEALIMIAPSPCYMNDGDYRGGFDRDAIAQMLDAISSNFLTWARSMAPAIMGNPARAELGAELTNSFCRMDPRVARQFARATFLSDNRDDLPKVAVPSLILQCSQDIIANEEIGRYVHRHTRGSHLALLNATGHCPHVSAPEETAAVILTFLGELRKVS